MTDAGFDADVAIVGYGPVGVSAANFLGHRGVRTVVLERDKDVYPRARAVTVNDWTLRAYQSVGLAEDLKADMDENGALIWKIYRDRKTVFQLNPASSGLGHPGSMMIYQPRMEATLRAGVERFPSVEVRFGEAVTGVEQDADGVTLALRNGSVRARTRSGTPSRPARSARRSASGWRAGRSRCSGSSSTPRCCAGGPAATT